MRTGLLLGILWCPIAAVAEQPSEKTLPSPAQRRVDFGRDIQPILAQACYSCHGPQKQRSGLRLDQKSAAFKGGDLGAPFVAGKSAESLLIRFVAGLDKEVVMPPSGPRLTPDQVGLLRAWIDQGAHWPDGGDVAQAAQTWWSLRPLQRPMVPKVADEKFLVRNPIDAFVLAKLREKKLAPSPEADRRTLIRRLHFDLIGLPATPEEVDAFVHNKSPRAYEELVDQLLGSPRYGERWARHWLDVVHFGETHGYDKDKPRPHAWPYRDYVIRAFNQDRPYHRFIEEQLAGDVLYPGTPDGIAALGFIAAGPWDLIGHMEVPETRIDGKITRHLDRDDMVATTMGTFVSMTASCAQCHNHKFDPITMEDYYSLQAVFAALDRADRSYNPDPAAMVKRDQLERRQRELETAGKELAKQVDSKAKEALATSLRQLDETRQELKKLPPAQLVYAGTIHHGKNQFAGTGANGGKPRPIHILARGDVKRPGALVGPGALSAVADLSSRFDLPANHGEASRRAALARWLTDSKNPLTWRSIVNRVWLYHFGRAIVDTPNDFGRMGQLPTHPELLDWLAVEFRDGGQSMKALHRLIVTSSTYRQSSAHRADAALADADNQYYWRMSRRRLEAEAVRDSILFVSGKLNLQMGGPSFEDFVIKNPEHSPHYKYELHNPEDPASHRRSIYRFIVRSQQQPFMMALDCADPSLAVEKRNQTITPHQALALLNNQLTLTMAKHFAARIQAKSDSPQDLAGAAFRLALGRSPTADEQALLTRYCREHGPANMCRVILNLNEFIFID